MLTEADLVQQPQAVETRGEPGGGCLVDLGKGSYGSGCRRITEVESRWRAVRDSVGPHVFEEALEI